jgi:L-rhamnose mutarotase
VAAHHHTQGRSTNERWQAEMRELFEELEGQRPDERMRPLEEVFHLP